MSAGNLPPPPSQQIVDLRKALAVYTMHCFLLTARTDPEGALAGLLCQLLDWCARERVDFEGALDSARRSMRVMR